MSPLEKYEDKEGFILIVNSKAGIVVVEGNENLITDRYVGLEMKR